MRPRNSRTVASNAAVEPTPIWSTFGAVTTGSYDSANVESNSEGISVICATTDER